MKIILVSTSELWAMSARTLLAQLDDMELLDPVYGSLSAYHIVELEHPHIMIIDDSLPFEEVMELVNRLRSENNPLYCIALVPTTRQRKIALAAGINSVIIRSDPYEQLETAILAAKKQLSAAD